MCFIYKSVDDFVNNVLFLVSPSFFGDIHKYLERIYKYEKIRLTNL